MKYRREKKNQEGGPGAPEIARRSTWRVPGLW